jgi:hypothetical protein
METGDVCGDARLRTLPVQAAMCAPAASLAKVRRQPLHSTRRSKSGAGAVCGPVGGAGIGVVRLCHAVTSLSLPVGTMGVQRAAGVSV